MKNGMLKKAFAVILSATMLTSVASVGSISASATDEPVVTVLATEMTNHINHSTEPEEDIENGGNGEVVDPPFEEENKIYFDVESSGWENYKRIYCHIWRYDGTGQWPNWQTRKEQCNKEADGRYSYTLSKTENEFRYSDGNVYGVIFSADTGAQTYEVVMNGKCIGDTVYVTGNTFENPEDSEKKVVDAAWRENKEGGTRKRITTTGNVVGNVHPEGYSDETLLADYLIKFYTSDTRMRELQNLFNELVADTTDVLCEVKLQLADEVSKGYKTQEEADKAYAEIEIILKGIYVDSELIHDINGDKRTDVMDVTTLQMYLASYDIKVKETKLDVNGDGIVDVKDVTGLQLYLAGNNPNRPGVPVYPCYDHIA